MISNTLSIAGTDPSGGAGVQADLKTFSALGTFGLSVITLVVAQNTQGVAGLHQISGEFVTKQLDVLFDDVRVDSVKIGALGNAEVIRAVAAAIRQYRPRYIVLDPVMVTTSGDKLLADEARDVLLNELLPLVDLITPNIPETAQLLNRSEATTEAEMADQCEELYQLGTGVLIKGGHLRGKESVDLLKIEGKTIRLATPRILTRNTHGTGCTLSAAIAALRPQREDWSTAVSEAKTYLTSSLSASELLEVGHGPGPVHHFHAIWK